MTTLLKNQTENRKTFHARLEKHFSKEDLMLIDYAYDLAKEAHRTQKRTKGGRYFEHPRQMCLILMDELELYDRDLIITLLLHDTGEDTPMFGSNYGTYKNFVITAKFRIEKTFGQKVSDNVIRLTKPFVDEVQFFTKDQVYLYYTNQLKEDEESILGKMIDRLHNLRSIPEDKPGWAEKQIKETEEVYLEIFSSVKGNLKPYVNVLFKKIQEELVTLKSVFN